MKKNGQARFEYYLNQLQALLVQSSKEINPALWLYQNNARTPLFMLEGLAKMYAGIHNKKKFIKIKEHCKLLEDGLGQIDYYDAFARELVLNKRIPTAITNYLQAQSREKIQSLNEILHKKNWLGDNANRIKKIRKKLDTADWQDAKEDIKNIHGFYINAINKILTFINEKDFQFTNVEQDLHEFRRMIRWLSIYPQALRGCIQLSKPKQPIPKYLNKYFTAAVKSSPYNIFPDAGDQKLFLLLDKNRFFALSWLISELGNLKDAGLKAEVIKEALLQTSPKTLSTKTNEKNIMDKAYKISGPSQKTIEQVLEDSEKIIKTYCKEKNLESLILGIAAIKP